MLVGLYMGVTPQTIANDLLRSLKVKTVIDYIVNISLTGVGTCIEYF